MLAATSQAAAVNIEFRKRLHDFCLRYSTVMTRRDSAGLTKLYDDFLTKDFVDSNLPDRTGHVGKMNRFQAEEEFKRKFGAGDVITNTSVHIDQVQDSGQPATALITTTFAATVKSSDGVNHKYGRVEQDAQTWIKAGNAWRLKANKRLKSSETMDGRRIWK